MFKVYRKTKKVYKYNSISTIDELLTMDERRKDQFISALIMGGLSGGKKTNFPQEKIDNGIKVEMEHVQADNPFSKIIAEKISVDHLMEDINYYEKLAKMENE